MMNFFIIITIFVIKTSSTELYDNVYLIFIGSNSSDHKNFTLYSDFSNIFGTKYFNASKPTAVFLHGWWNSLYKIYGREFSKAYLTRNDFNIILAEWSYYAYKPNYFEVVELMPKIASVYVQLFKKIGSSSTGYDLSKLHLIGFSVGAHMAGQIGRSFKSENILLSRITGLDPAGPSYIKPFTINILGLKFTIPGYPGLSKGDAKFVDIIHTYAGTMGTTESIGDIDFWPNEGANQPECIGFPLLEDEHGFGCSHASSWRYYVESVRSEKPIFIAQKCVEGLTHNKETCRGPATASMGFYASSTSEPGNYYLETRASSPYSY